jgi:hypothetical protein
MRILIVLTLLAAVAGCATKELDLAKAQGFSGTVSYSKAAGLLTRAKTNQVVEDYAECIETAERARFYIAESRKGR